MKRLVLPAAAAFAVLLALGFAAMHRFNAPPADLDLSRSRPTEAGRFEVSVEPEGGEPRPNTLHAWIVTLKTAGGTPVEGAAIAVDGGMPQHGHGLPTAPQMTAYLGDGRYRIEGMRFNMTGWWEIRLAIEAPEGEDRVTFNLAL